MVFGAHSCPYGQECGSFFCPKPMSACKEKARAKASRVENPPLAMFTKISKGHQTVSFFCGGGWSSVHILVLVDKNVVRSFAQSRCLLARKRRGQKPRVSRIHLTRSQANDTNGIPIIKQILLTATQQRSTDIFVCASFLRSLPCKV